MSKRPCKFEIRRSRDGLFYLVFVAGNGQDFVGGETYSRKASARNAAKRIKEEASTAEIVDLTKRKEVPPIITGGDALGEDQ